MTVDEFIEYIEERTYPFKFLENGRAQLSELFRKYPEPYILKYRIIIEELMYKAGVK